jgi:aspartyl-tRNA(Asn)/glutamyl-tRNA(Gln) amidotransferase subunit A
MEKPSLTIPFNLTGYPAMSVCTGLGAGGLPVSMQLVAKPFAEATLFQAGTRAKRGGNAEAAAEMALAEVAA